MDSEPEPDGVIARGDRHSHPGRHPGPIETLLVIEVADSSLGLDRKAKSQIYARDSLPVYWIINLVDRQVEVLTDPDPALRVYQTTTIYKPGDSVPVVPVVLDGTVVSMVAMNELMP